MQVVGVGELLPGSIYLIYTQKSLLGHQDIMTSKLSTLDILTAIAIFLRVTCMLRTKNDGPY